MRLSVPPQAETSDHRSVKYPYVRGRGSLGSSLGMLQMLSQHLGSPSGGMFCADHCNSVDQRQHFPPGVVPLQNVSLNSQLVNVPAVAVSRRKLQRCSGGKIASPFFTKQVKRTGLAVPESGIRRIKPADFIEAWGEAGQVYYNHQSSQAAVWPGMV